MKKVFKLTLQAVKGEGEFVDLVEQTMEYDLRAKDYSSPMFIKSLIDSQDEFINKYINVKLEESIMTFEEFWEKWNPCDCSEWGYGAGKGKNWMNDERLCKKEMFDDIIKILLNGTVMAVRLSKSVDDYNNKLIGQSLDHIREGDIVVIEKSNADKSSGV